MTSSPTKITFSKEVSRLIYKRCAIVPPRGRIPFSLMTYEEARPWAKVDQGRSAERRMPPWQAVKGFGDFKDDRGLTAGRDGDDLGLGGGRRAGGEPKFLPAAPKADRVAGSGDARQARSAVDVADTKPQLPAVNRWSRCGPRI